MNVYLFLSATLIYGETSFTFFFFFDRKNENMNKFGYLFYQLIGFYGELLYSNIMYVYLAIFETMSGKKHFFLKNVVLFGQKTSDIFIRKPAWILLFFSWLGYFSCQSRKIGHVFMNIIYFFDSVQYRSIRVYGSFAWAVRG